MENIIEITNLYILVLLLALLIERYMEIFMATWNYIEWKFGLEEFWNRRAEKLNKNVKPKLNIIWPEPDLDVKAEKLFEKLSKDKKLSYCDVISFIVIKEILDNIPCATFDSDFRTLGLTVIT